LVVHLIISLPLHHASRSFQSINTSPEDKTKFHFETSSHVEKIVINYHMYTMFVNDQLIYQSTYYLIFHLLNLLQIMILKPFKNTKIQMLFIGLVSINTRILKTIVENYYYYFLTFCSDWNVTKENIFNLAWYLENKRNVLSNCSK